MSKIRRLADRYSRRVIVLILAVMLSVSIIAQIAPLLGLLGTVIGFIKTVLTARHRIHGISN